VALLLRVRYPGGRRGPSLSLSADARSGTRARQTIFLRIPLILILLVAPTACKDREQANPNPPDSLLRDSLGLTPADHVHRIVLSSNNGTESIAPSEVVVQAGHFVEFFTRDRRVRTVAFLLDSLNAEQSAFLRSTGQDRSPPLVELETRFVVSFQGAPAGRYPFIVEGNERAISGVVIVGDPEPER
jgi:hypothetical protein